MLFLVDITRLTPKEIGNTLSLLPRSNNHFVLVFLNIEFLLSSQVFIPYWRVSLTCLAGPGSAVLSEAICENGRADELSGSDIASQVGSRDDRCSIFLFLGIAMRKLSS